jgi:hypothetical protein
MAMGGLALLLSTFVAQTGRGAQIDQTIPLDSTRVEPPPSRVGGYGDVSKLLVIGAKAFPDTEIYNALRMNAEFLLAAHPVAPFSKYLETIKTAVRAGYLQGGFPDVQVEAVFDTERDKVVIVIGEGKRYLAGDIEVVGAKTLSTNEVIRRLLGPYPLAVTTSSGSMRLDRSGREIQPEPPAWIKGGGASFHPTALQFLTTRTTNILADLGYLFPKMTVALVPKANKGTANAVIKILEEGPRAQVDEIEVVGAQKNKPEDLLKVTGLKKGIPLDRNVIWDAELALWNTGRFLDQAVTPERRGDESKIKLRVTVVEDSTAPPLRTQLAAAEKALLKTRDWLAHWTASDEDLLVRWSGPNSSSAKALRLEATVSPRHGVILSLANANRGAAEDQTCNLVLGEKLVEWSVVGHGAKLAGSHPGVQLKTMVNYTTTTNQNLPCLFEFGFGFTASGDDKNTIEPFKLECLFAPAAFLHLDQRTNLSCVLEGSRFTIRNRDMTNGLLELQADASSGRLLDFRLGGKKSGSEVHVRFDKGKFDERLRAIEQASAKQRNSYAQDRPVSSITETLISDLSQVDSFIQFVLGTRTQGNSQPAAKALSKILNRQTLAPWDQSMTGVNLGTQTFFIPVEQTDGPNANQEVLAMISAIVFRFSDDFFPKQSWPWTAARESVFVLKGQSQYTDSELQRLYDSPDTGPLGFLTISKLLERANSPAARPFATRGLVRLGADDFHKDARLFLQDNSVLAKSVHNMARALGQLNDQEVDSLASIFPVELGDFLREAARQLRRNPTASLEDALSPALDHLWEGSLKAQVRTALLGVIGAVPQDK